MKLNKLMVFSVIFLMIMSSGVFGQGLDDKSGDSGDSAGPIELCPPMGDCIFVEELIEWGTHLSNTDIGFGDVDNTDTTGDQDLFYTRDVFTETDMIIDDVIYPPFGVSTVTVNVPSSYIGSGAGGAEAEVWAVFDFQGTIQAYHMTIKNQDTVTPTSGGGGSRRTSDGEVIEATEIIEVVELPEVEGRLIYTGQRIFFESYDTPGEVTDLGPVERLGQIGLVGAGLIMGSQWAGFFLFDNEPIFVPYDGDAVEVPVSDLIGVGLYDPFDPVHPLTVSTPSSSTITSSKPAKNDTNKSKECECSGSAWAIVECKGKWSSSKVNEVNSGLDADGKPIWTATVTQDKWTWTNSQTGEELFSSPNTDVADMNARVEEPVDSCPGDGCKNNQDCLPICQAAATKKVNDEIEKLKKQCEGGDVFVISSGNNVGGACVEKCEEKEEGGTDTSSPASSSTSSTPPEPKPEPKPKRAGICWCSIKAEKYGYCHDEDDDLEDEDWDGGFTREVIGGYRAAGAEANPDSQSENFNFNISNYSDDDRYTGSGYTYNHVPKPNPLPAKDGGTVTQTMYVSPPLPVLGRIPLIRGPAGWSHTLLSIVKFTYEFEGYTGSCDPDEMMNEDCKPVCTAKYQNGLKGLITQKQEKCKGDWYPPNNMDNEPDTDADNLDMAWFCKAAEAEGEDF